MVSENDLHNVGPAVVQKRDRSVKVSGIESGYARFKKFSRFCGLEDLRRSSGRVFCNEHLALVRFHGASKSKVITGAGSGQFAHLKAEGALGDERMRFEMVA